MTSDSHTPSDDHGMNRQIDRRDFLNGMAIAVGAALCPMHSALAAPDSGPDPSRLDPLLAQGITQDSPRYYPPALQGMRGSHPGSFEAAHHLRDEKRWHESADVIDTHESYDLIVVGAGISGLSAAYFFHKQKPDARILILDNHDDFGGHAKRNEFQTQRGLLLGYGGTQSIDGPRSYSAPAKALLKEIGIETQRFFKYYDHSYYSSLNTHPALFFDRETFGADRLVLGRLSDVEKENVIMGSLDNFKAFQSPECIAQMPIAEAARADLRRLIEQSIDYLAEVPADQRYQTLVKTSYRDYLLKYAKVHPEVPKVMQQMTHDLSCVGIEAVSAERCRQQNFPGFKGVKVTEEKNETRDRDEPYIFHFPDGNASVARLLVRALIPQAMPGHTMEDVVTAKAVYPALDKPGQRVRIRLNSTAVSVRHQGDQKAVEVVYVYNGKSYKVGGSGAVMACYNCAVPYLCPDMPERQKQALSYSVKMPLVYTNVQLRSWRAFQKLGVHTIYMPGHYWSGIWSDFPVSMGSYHYPKSPDEPCVVHVQRTPCSPGLSDKEQHRAGRWELYNTPFATYESTLRDLFDRILGPAGFDSARDIQAITVNRWPHGYAYGDNELFAPLDQPPSERPHVIGRQPFGRITIANSDSGASADTSTAITQGHRAVEELMAAMTGTRQSTVMSPVRGSISRG